MYKNFTFIAAGELLPQIGMHQSSGATLTLATYDNIDQLRMMATNVGLQSLFDLIIPYPNKITYDDFNSNEEALVSALSYSSSGVVAVVNKKLATAGIKRDETSLKFADDVNGRVATLHAMLRLLFNIVPPLDTILGQVHNLFTTILYTLIIRNFNADYSLIDLSDEHKASLRYACACISASKHFELTCALNDVCIPMTAMLFSTVRESAYVTNNNITSYEAFSLYLKEKVNIDIDRSTFINKILTSFSTRTLIILECGVDFMIDCLLSKINGTTLIPRKLANGLISPQMYTTIKTKIAQSYYQQLSLNIPR